MLQKRKVIVGGIPKGKDFGIILEQKDEGDVSLQMRHFQEILLFWSMLITCSEKRRLRGEERTLWKHRSGIWCPLSPLWLAAGKRSDCGKGYLTRGESTPVVGIVWGIDWRGVTEPLQAFNSREADRARGGSDRPALSSYSFMGMSPSGKCWCEAKPCYGCGQTEVLHRLRRQRTCFFEFIHVCYAV